MIVGIGTDLLHIPRIKALIAKRGAPTLARRILSPRELTEFKALIRGKLDRAQEVAQGGTGTGAGAGAKGDNVERTSFRTVLKGLNRNIENDAVTRFLASRWAAKEAAYKALYPLYVTPSGSSSTSSPSSSSSSHTPSSSPSSPSPASSSSSSSTTTTTTFTSTSSLKPYGVLPTRTPHVPSTHPSSPSSDPSTPLQPNLTWKSVDLHYVASKPHLRYTYGYGQRIDLERDSHERKIRMPRLHVSLSHDGDYVSAVVVAEEEGGEGRGTGGSGGTGGKGEGKGGVVVREYR